MSNRFTPKSVKHNFSIFQVNGPRTDSRVYSEWRANQLAVWIFVLIYNILINNMLFVYFWGHKSGGYLEFCFREEGEGG